MTLGQKCFPVSYKCLFFQRSLLWHCVYPKQLLYVSLITIKHCAWSKSDKSNSKDCTFVTVPLLTSTQKSLTDLSTKNCMTRSIRKNTLNYPLSKRSHTNQFSPDGLKLLHELSVFYLCFWTVLNNALFFPNKYIGSSVGL